jgi:beta-lactam-binding protein with PASTA domain
LLAHQQIFLRIPRTLHCLTNLSSHTLYIKSPSNNTTTSEHLVHTVLAQTSPSRLQGTIFTMANSEHFMPSQASRESTPEINTFTSDAVARMERFEAEQYLRANGLPVYAEDSQPQDTAITMASSKHSTPSQESRESTPETNTFTSDDVAHMEQFEAEQYLRAKGFPVHDHTSTASGRHAENSQPQDTAFTMAKSQISREPTPETDTFTAEAVARMERFEAEQESLRGKGFPLYDYTSTTSGRHAETSIPMPNTNSPVSHIDLGDSILKTPYTENPFAYSDRGSSFSPALFPSPVERAAIGDWEASEAAVDDQSILFGHKRSREAMEGPDEGEYENSGRHKVAKIDGPSFLSHDVETPAGETLGKRKRSRTSMAEQEEEKVELPPRKKFAGPAAYIDLTTSENVANPSDIIDLTGSDSGSPPPPPQPLQESYLYKLPPELRNRIYRHVGLYGGRVDLRNHEEPALAQAIPSLKDELHSFIFSENKLRVPVYSTFIASHRPDPTNEAPKKERLGDFNNSPFSPGVIGIAPDSWVMNVDPRAMAIRHICFRIMEAEERDGSHKHLCDHFLNVKWIDGKPKVFGRTIVAGTDILKRKMNQMSYLATARAQRFAQQEGFEGLNWEQAQHIAASFVSIADAKKRYTRKGGKTTLI